MGSVTVFPPAQIRPQVRSTDATAVQSTGLISGHLHTDLVSRGFSGNLIAGNELDGLYFRDFSLDMGELATGHAVAIQDSSNITFDNFAITNLGDPGTAAGTGILVVTTDSVGKDGPWNENVSVRNGVIHGAEGASRSYGVIQEYSKYSLIQNIVGHDLTRWVAEFKHDTRYSRQDGIIGHHCAYTIGSGQSDPDVNGSDYNLYSNNISANCDSAAVFGEAVGNLINGLLVDMTDGPGYFANKRAIEFQDDCSDNAAFAVASHGTETTDNPVRITGPRNYVQLASFDAASVIVRYETGAARNVVSVVHPGARSNMNGAVEDLSGSTGTDKNILISPATGEQFGTMSGRFHWRIEESGASFSTAQRYRFENDDSYTLAFGLPGTSGQSAGLAWNTASVQRSAEITHVFGASAAAAYTKFRVNETDVLRLYADRFRPVTDAAYALGEAALRFSTIYTVALRATTINFTEIAAASVSTPGAGSQTMFIDSADHLLKLKDSSGTVTAV